MCSLKSLICDSTSSPKLALLSQSDSQKILSLLFSLFSGGLLVTLWQERCKTSATAQLRLTSSVCAESGH